MSRMTRTPKNLIEATAAAWDAVRDRGPLVQCLTNTVVANFTANVLLAIGAAPAMVDIPDEAGPFTALASGMLINLGTPTHEQRTAMVEAASAARATTTPWVLDPVAVGALPVRTQLAAQLVADSPTVVRGNASEILALDGAGAGGRGVDSQDWVDDAAPAATRIAQQTGGVVAVSGPVDFITDGTREAKLSNGSVLLTRITGGGCALGAVMAAFVATVDDPFIATAAAVSTYNVAAELAAEKAAGPGTFSPAFIDALANLRADDLRSRVRIS
jgi:hydroxyethylthiazole kinase